MLLDYFVIALPVLGQPEAGRQALGFNVSGKFGHAFGESVRVDSGPVAPAFTCASSLPAIVNLYVLSAVILQVCRDPISVAFHFLGIDAGVVVIPRTPAGRRQRKAGFVDRLKVFYPERV